jgi:hypothetical protein
MANLRPLPRPRKEHETERDRREKWVELTQTEAAQMWRKLFGTAMPAEVRKAHKHWRMDILHDVIEPL